MKNKKEILEFIKNIDYLLKITNLLWINDYKNYIFTSPFVYNKIDWCKDTKSIMEEILKQKLWSINLIELNFQNIDIDIFIKIHKLLPSYKENFQKWINLMYYSTINLESQKNGRKINKIFTDNNKLININTLSVKEIVFWLDLMFLEWKKLLESKNNINCQTNNLLLMLISDYRDILEWTREKRYNFNKHEIDKNMKYIEQALWKTRIELFSLNFIQLINSNIWTIKD